MSDFNISIPGGQTKRFLTAGKYCKDNIVVTAEGSNGGSSGDDVSGVYLSAVPFLGMTTKYSPFSLNGELYATGSGSAGSGYLNKIYKWNGGSWVTLLSSSSTSAGINGTKLDSGAMCVEYHGKVHFLSGKGNEHGVFDGTAFTILGATPGSTEGVYPAVYQDKLIAYFTSLGTVYAWEEETDEWIAVAQLSAESYQKYYLHVVNGELYAIYGVSCYKYVDGAKVRVNTNNLTDQPGSSYSHGDYIYYFSNKTTYSKLYRYNPQADELVSFDFPPFTGNALYSIGDDLLYMGRTHSSYSSYNPCFKVSIM